jgi:hypothetical protein
MPTLWGKVKKVQKLRDDAFGVADPFGSYGCDGAQSYGTEICSVSAFLVWRGEAIEVFGCVEA